MTRTAAENTMTITTTGSLTVLDETSGLQNSIATQGVLEDENDTEISLSLLPSLFSNRLTALQAGTATNAALGGYTGTEGNTGSNAFTISAEPGANITDISFVGSDGAALNGLDSGLTTLDGTSILLYTDTTNNILLGRAGGPTGAIVFAAYIEETGTPVSGGKIWTVEYQPLMHPDTTDPDDALDLTGKVFIGTSEDLAFSLANAPSGQNLFLIFTTATPTVVDGRIMDPTIIATGKNPADQSSGASINTGDTINSSQAGGPTTFGTNNQMITEQEGIRFTFVTGARQDRTIPNLDQNEADVESNIDFSDVFNVRSASFDVVQLQSGKTAVVKISAFTTEAEPGEDFINGYADDTSVAITNIRVINISTGQVIENSDGSVNDPGIAITFTPEGVATITGVKAGYKIEYTTTTDHNRVLIENGAAVNAKGNNHADFDIGGFKLTHVSTDKGEIGSKLVFEDDGPSATGTAASGTVDEDGLTGGIAGGTGDVVGMETTASGSVTGIFQSGADAPLSYSLASDTSGLPQTLKSGGVTVTYNVLGNTLTVSAGVTPVFTFSLTAAGLYSFTLLKALDHAAGNDENDIPLNLGSLLQATDADGDTVTAAPEKLVITVDDDTPTLAFGNLIGTGTVLPQYGNWSMAAGADGLGAAGLDISLVNGQFTLIRPDDTTTTGTGTLNDLSPSPDANGAYHFAGSLTGDFDNDATTADTTIDYTLTAFANGTYALDLVQGFSSTVVLSSADGSLDAGGPDPVRTLLIPKQDTPTIPSPSEEIVFFGVNANTTADQVLSAIVQGAPDLTEAQIEAGGFSFLGTANMNVSTSGIGIANNNLEGNGTAGINSGDESFVINPETLLTAVKVFIDNSLQGYNPATEELYYRVFFEDGTSSAQTKVLAADLASEAGGQKSFLVQWDDVKMIDAVQLSMGLGAIKVPVIQFIKQVENMANDVQLAFNATLTDKDGDTASSTFEAKLFANDPNDQLFDYRLAGTIGEQDAFNIDLSAAENLYQVNGFDVGPDKLMLIGDPGAAIQSIDNSGADSIVTIDESGAQTTTITVVGVDLTNADILFGGA
ncbi:T1SS-143 repeat domain protein [compost metagenome]